MANLPYKPSDGNGGERIAVLLLLALVICFLSNLFASADAGRIKAIIGVPDSDEETSSDSAIMPKQEDARRLDRSISNEAYDPTGFRESGIPKG